MRILKIYDDYLRLHTLGLDRELQKELPDWRVEYYHVHASRKKIERVFPDNLETDGLDLNTDDEVLILWNYFWSDCRNGFQEEVKKKILKLVEQGAKIRMRLYTSYGTYGEAERELKDYRKYYGSDVVFNNVEVVMHVSTIIPIWAKREAQIIRRNYK